MKIADITTMLYVVLIQDNTVQENQFQLAKKVYRQLNAMKQCQKLQSHLLARSQFGRPWCLHCHTVTIIVVSLDINMVEICIICKKDDTLLRSYIRSSISEQWSIKQLWYVHYFLLLNTFGILYGTVGTQNLYVISCDIWLLAVVYNWIHTTWVLPEVNFEI